MAIRGPKGPGGDEYKRIETGRTHGAQKTRDAEGIKQADQLRKTAKNSSSIAKPIIQKSARRAGAEKTLQDKNVTDMTRAYKHRGVVRSIMKQPVKSPRDLEGRVTKSSYRENAVPLRLAPAGGWSAKPLQNRATNQTPTYKGAHTMEFPPKGTVPVWGDRESELL